MTVCECCGNPHRITVGQFIGRWKGQDIREEWEECSVCGNTRFVEAKPEWICNECEHTGMFEELKYDEFNDEEYCPHCGSRRLYEV